MNQNRLCVWLLLAAVAAAQSCTLSDSQKKDCGYIGINQQQCEGKGCCWKPVGNQESNDVPWCYYAANTACDKFNYDQSGGPGFDSAFYDKMYALYLKNINIEGKGGVAAAPGPGAPAGSYYYHWMRDAGLTMRSYIELNDNNLTKISEKLKSYVNWVLHVQSLTDPYGNDIRINPKFELPNGEVYIGGWCRPQTDGPGLTSASLVMFANLLLDAKEDAYVYQYLWTKDGSKNGGAIKYDLDWIVKHWQSDGCDLWEEQRDSNLFWNRMAFAYALGLASKLATRVGDSSLASTYSSTKSAIEATLNGHWTGEYMMEAFTGRQQDGAVIHAFSSFPGYYSWTDAKVSATIRKYAKTFCDEYPINQQDNTAGVPGILIGRYPGDVYAGGNPWQLLTAVLAELFYKGATAMTQHNYVLEAEAKKEWALLLNLPDTADQSDIAMAAAKAGDAVLFRLWKYVKNDNGHINEQIDKHTGKQTSAEDLTWSYANILSALHYRNTHLSELLSATTESTI